MVLEADVFDAFFGNGIGGVSPGAADVGAVFVVQDTEGWHLGKEFGDCVFKSFDMDRVASPD